MYVPYNQLVVGAVPIVMRAESAPETLISPVRKEIQAVDSEVAIGKVRTMTQLMSVALAERRFALFLLGIFAVIAVALASVGVYGVISYTSTRRIHEMGVRMALGATRAEILQLIIGWAIRITLVGISVGVVGAFALSRMMSSLLFGVRATDLLTFAGASTIILLISLLAGYLPAYRATKVDPAIALRSE
jgi:ABC-type antimicrobial peptide transport system permease subunit